MTAMSIRLPDSLHRNARSFAEREGISVNQLVATALAEKLAALGAEDYLKSRADRANRTQFEQALAQVPSVPAAEGDELPHLRAAPASKRRLTA
jgi:hypothetical protein